jgi:mycoredoxin
MEEDNGADMIVVYGTWWCPDCRRVNRLLKKRGIEYRWVNIAKDPAAMAIVEEINQGLQSVPTIIFPDGEILVEPSSAELEAKLDTNTDSPQ